MREKRHNVKVNVNDQRLHDISLRAHTYHTVVLLATPSLTLTLTLTLCPVCGRLLALPPAAAKKWKRVQPRPVRPPRAAAALSLWLRGRAPLLSRARAASRSRLGAPPPRTRAI